MKNAIKKFFCFIGEHKWDKYAGFYQEKPAPDAVCDWCGHRRIDDLVHYE